MDSQRIDLSTLYNLKNAVDSITIDQRNAVNVQQVLIENGYYPLTYLHEAIALPEPKNQADILKRLSVPDASISSESFADKEFKMLRYMCERDQINDVIRMIEGAGVLGDQECKCEGLQLTNLRRLANDIPLPQAGPDRFYGASQHQLKNQGIRTELDDLINPSREEENVPILPNFFLGAKRASTNYEKARAEAWYFGLLGARGMHSLQTYGQEKTYDNNAYTITCLYQTGTLKMFTVHLVPPDSPEDPPKYAMHYLDAWSLTGNVENCRQALTAYGNARGLAEEWRTKLIDHANGKIKSSIPTTESDDRLAGGVTTKVHTGTSKRRSQKGQTLSRPSKRPKVQD